MIFPNGGIWEILSSMFGKALHPARNVWPKSLRPVRDALKIARYAKIPAAKPREFSVPGKLTPNMKSPARDG